MSYRTIPVAERNLSSLHFRALIFGAAYVTILIAALAMQVAS